MIETVEKRCLYCNNPLSGRADKIFCDDRCRNNYYYKVNSEPKEYIRNINKILLKNRGILKVLNPSSRTSVSRQDLDKLGFDFSHFTGTHITKKGRLYYLVYDHAYNIDEQDRVSLVVFHRET